MLANAAAALIRSGFDPAATLIGLGLDPIAHLGLLPVTVQKPAAGGDSDELQEDLQNGDAKAVADPLADPLETGEDPDGVEDPDA